jgi:hypothetical protein
VFGGEAGADDVVAACHELDYFSPDVSVRQAGGKKNRFSTLQAEDVEEEHGKNANVSTVLGVKIKDEGVPSGTAAAASADLQRAGADGGVAAVGVGAAEGEGAGAGLCEGPGACHDATEDCGRIISTRR